MTTDRLDEIETRLTFQERTLLDLNDVIVNQQNQIDQLKRSYNQLQGRISSLAESTTSQHENYELPPHY